MASVTFEGVAKTYPDGTKAVIGLDLTIEDGEFMVFVGPSGCGKTTALRMVAGLEEITGGQLRIGDRVVNDVEPRKRDAAMVFQNYALYPHMSVYDNIAFPLQAQKVDKAEIKERVNRTAALLGLTEHLKRRPRNLSGGQKQRVAMGRAIVRQPQVFLMDEPLSNLDAKLRVQMRTEITALQADLGVTTIYVTHDQVEAMTMGDRIAVMRKGVLQQEGAPQQLYDEPVNLFVAEFIGSPAMNLLTASIEEVAQTLTCIVGDARLDLPAEVTAARPGLRGYVGGEVALGIRPENLVEPSAGREGDPRLRGVVKLVETLGPERHVHIELPARPVVTEELIEIARDIDAVSAASLGEETSVTAIARFEASSQIESGVNQEVSISPSRMHFFDLATGQAIR